MTTTADRLRQLAAALPSDRAAVTLTRSDLLALVDAREEGAAPGRDLTVEEVATEVGRAPVTVRGWLVAGALRGYKLNHRDWRVPRSALREYLDAQRRPNDPTPDGDVDLGAWRTVRQRKGGHTS